MMKRIANTFLGQRLARIAGIGFRSLVALSVVALPLHAGPARADIVNTATVTATFPNIGPVTSPPSTATVLLQPPAPGLTVTKTATLNDDDGKPGVTAGDTIDFVITAENTGNQAIDGFTLTDQLTQGATVLALDSAPVLISGDTFDPGRLNAGETWTYEATFTLDQDSIDFGQDIINTATGEGVAGTTPIADTSTVTVPVNAVPSILLTKTATSTSYAAVGDIVTWDISVENNGAVTFDTVLVSDPLADSIVCAFSGDETISTLVVGASEICVASRAVTATDVSAGSINNTATATGTTPGGATAESSDTATVSMPAADLVTVKTLLSTSSAPLPGETVSYLITVTNNGPLDATNVSLTDLLPAELAADGTNGTASTGSYDDNTGLWTIGTLANGANATLTLSGTVLVNAGSSTITNTTTPATGDQVDPDPTTDVLTVVVTPTLRVIDAVDDAVTTPLDAANDLIGVLNVFDNDTLGGAGADPTSTTVVPTGAMPAGIALNADGSVDIAAGTAPGTYTFEYTLCEIDVPTNCDTATVTIPVVLSTPTVSGVVYLDVDSNGTFGGPDVVQPGYTVALVDIDGNTVATQSTGPDGSYLFESVPSGIYTIVFTSPTGIGVGYIPGVVVNTGDVIVDQNMPVDPSGVIYDSVTGAPVPGATVSIYNAATGAPLPAACLLPNQQSQVTDATGQYRFDILPGAAPQCPAAETEYRVGVVPPTGYEVPPSTRIAPQTGPLDVATCPLDVVPGGSCALSITSTPPSVTAPTPYFFTFLIGAGYPDVVNNHIPLDPVQTPVTGDLSITKRALSTVVRRGDAVGYVITVTNNAVRPYSPLVVRDRLPAGFAFIEGSATVDGAAVIPEVNGRTLVFNSLSVPATGQLEITLSARVGATVVPGEHVNVASLASAAGTKLAPEATATVRVEGEPVFDCGDVIGKVFDDKNRNGYQDKGEPGIAGARVATVRGTLITADAFGRFSVPCAELPDRRIGTNFILKLDTRSLPTGYRLTTENPRVVRLTAGKVTELNFGVAATRVVRIDLDRKAFNGTGAEPSVALIRGIEHLVKALEAEPSVLRLTYYRNREDRALIRRRLDAVQTLVSNQWKNGRKDYDLPVEVRIVDR